MQRGKNEVTDLKPQRTEEGLAEKAFNRKAREFGAKGGKAYARVRGVVGIVCSGEAQAWFVAEMPW